MLPNVEILHLGKILEAESSDLTKIRASTFWQVEGLFSGHRTRETKVDLLGPAFPQHPPLPRPIHPAFCSPPTQSCLIPHLPPTLKSFPTTRQGNILFKVPGSRLSGAIWSQLEWASPLALQAVWLAPVCLTALL